MKAISIPKKLQAFFVSLMEAKCDDMPVGEYRQAVDYISERDIYIGAFHKVAATQAEKLGYVTLVEDEDGAPAIKINERSDFLVSFASGVQEANKGNDAYYSDYASHKFAFCVGHAHALSVAKSKINYDVEGGSYCHGFALSDTDEEVFKQP